MELLMEILQVFTGLLCFWSVIGYFFVAICRLPKDKKKSVVYLILAGPLCWILFVIVNTDKIYKK